MQVSITARHGHLSEASQEKIRAKAEKLVRFFDRIMAIEVVIDLEDDAHPSVEVLVSAEHKHDFVAADKSTSMHGSLDAALHKVEQQLRKYKEKTLDRHRNAAPRMEEIPLDGDDQEDEADVDAEIGSEEL